MSASDLGPGQVRFSRGGQGGGNFGQQPYGCSGGGGGNLAKPIFTLIAIAGLFYLNECPSRKPTSHEMVTSTFTLTTAETTRPDSPTSGRPNDSSQNTPFAKDVQELIPAARSGTLVLPSTTCTEDGFAFHCLPAAPVKPSKVAVFSFQRPDQVSTSDEVSTPDRVSTAGHVFDQNGLVVNADRVVVNVVNTYNDLPDDVKRAGIELHTSADFISALVPAPSPAVELQRLNAYAPPLIFHGDVRVDVGPLVDQDKMLSLFLVNNSKINSLETFYEPSSARGPPRVPVQVIYVIGTVESYTGPDELQKSVHTAGVFDIDLSPSHEQQAAYEADLKTWRHELASKAGMSADLLKDAVDDNAALTIVQAHRERTVFPGKLPEPNSLPVDLFPPRDHTYPTEFNLEPIERPFERGPWRNSGPEVYRPRVEPRPRMMFK